MRETFSLLQGEWGWLLQVLIILSVVVATNFFQRRLMRRLHDKFKLTSNMWDDAVIVAAQKPLGVLVWLIGLTFIFKVLQQESGAQLFSLFAPARDVAVIVTLLWFSFRLITNLQEAVIARREAAGKSVDKTTVDAVGKLLRTSAVIIAALVMLQTLGFSVSGILAFGGIGGIAVGFAAKDILANFFGGLMIYLDRPFEVGDWVRSPDKSIEGTVEHIGWRLTCIRTFSKRPIYVPNSVFANIVVENPSRMTHRRIEETIGLRYDDAEKVTVILRDIEAMLRQHKDIDSAEPIMVYFDKYSASSLDCCVDAYTKTVDLAQFRQVKQDVLLRVYEIITRHAAQVAFPTSTVHWVGNEGESTQMGVLSPENFVR